MRLVLALVAFAACDATGAPAPTATLEIGSGADGYVALVDGGTIAAYMGPQGGFHVYLQLRASGIDPGSPTEAPSACSFGGDFHNPCVDFTVTDVVTGRVLDVFSPLRLAFTDDHGYFLSERRLVQLDIRSLDEVDGKRLRLAATLTDRNGLTVTASSADTAVAQRPDAGL